MNTTDLDQLKVFEIFRGLTDAQYQSLAQLLTPEKSAFKGKILIEQDEKSSDLFFILEGRVEISIREEAINTINPGGILGEAAILRRGPTKRMATVTALSDIVFFQISVEKFLDVVKKDPEMYIKILENLGIILEDRCQTMNYSIRNLMR